MTRATACLIASTSTVQGGKSACKRVQLCARATACAPAAAMETRQPTGNCAQFSTASQSNSRSVRANASMPAAFQRTIDRFFPGSTRLQSNEWKPGIPWAQMPWHVALGALQSLQNDGSSKRFLTGETAPVFQEVHTHQLEVVEGAVPDSLDGVYMRTGPNPQYEPRGGYLMVDGEAMVHAVMLRGGKAQSYANHWLRCARFVDEQRAGDNIYPRIGDLVGIPGLFIMLLTQLNPRMFPQPSEYLNYQLGNTSLTFHNKKLLALMEGGMPFQLNVEHSGARMGELQSVGPYDFDGSMAEATSGHPKICPRTGELHSFFYRVAKTSEDQHLCVYHVASPDGKLSQDYPVDISKGQMVHDFAITDKYAVFCDAAVAFDPKSMITKGTLPFSMDKSQPSRIGLLSRQDPTAPMRWFDVKPFAFFHIANAWEEGDHVHVVICRFNNLDISNDLKNGFDEDFPEVYRFSLNLKTGATEETCLLPGRSADFPTIPSHLVGKPTRFCYVAVASHACDTHKHFSTTGIIKVDMMAPANDGNVGEVHLGEGMIGGEASFIPRDAAAAAAGNAAEDDGFLVTYTTDCRTKESFCMIYDAQTMSNTPVAKIKMPQRVPVGLHGIFLPSSELEKQV